MLKRTTFICLFICFHQLLFSQEKTGEGVLTANVMDEQSKALAGATVQLISLEDSLSRRSSVSDESGQVAFVDIPFGHYRLLISYTGLQPLTLDSIHFRTKRFDFNLTDLVLKSRTADNLETVVIYAEKPLIQSSEGNITFNVGESALAAGSNASDLLTNVPLVAKDADGKITVRGKEPKILIDDKPVELNLQQLQDLLESLPGSSIEKIEVMTNPPPQYANEQGGVINITTKKGKVGKSGRVSLTSGTRGEASLNGSFTYRKQGFSVNINGGGGFNRFQGSGYSTRNNIYTDSSNFFNTTNNYSNKALRPNFRMNIDYDINKNNLLNLVIGYNQNDFDNTNTTEYRNINRFGDTWRLSKRQVRSIGNSISPNMTLSYTWKGQVGETFRVISTHGFSANESDREFFQEFYNPVLLEPNGLDSLQQQLNSTKIDNHNVRVNYDRMLKNKKTFISIGSMFNRSNNHVVVDASYKKKPENTMEKLDMLSNDLWFHQTINNYRASVRQVLGTQFSITAGTSLEKTSIWFELLKEGRDVRNNYWTWLPFANINKTWRDKLSITMAYRRSIRRPGINELNPTIDFSDPYNTRFGNERLEASTSHNFDLVLGRTKPKYYINLGMGHNIVEDIFSQIRTLQADGKTEITWENTSGRKEYEISTWNGITINRKIRVNASASYTLSKYSEYDKTVRRFRDGGSFTSNMNSNYTASDKMNFTMGYNVNRFANPQGFARWNTSMNMSVQRKFLNKRLIVTVNVIDPFTNQQRRIFTYGPNFNLESFSTTQTRNFRLTVAYNLTQVKKKKSVLQQAREMKSK